MNRVAARAAGIEEPPWLPRLARVARRVMRRLEIENQELSLLVCGNAMMRSLNRDFRGKDRPTDVLSFPQESPPAGARKLRPSGDIVISIPMARTNARAFNVEVGEELKRLLIHGILHLKGMDHRTNSPREPMLRLQEEILKSLASERLL